MEKEENMHSLTFKVFFLYKSFSFVWLLNKILFIMFKIVWYILFFEIFFIWKYIKIIYFILFLKIIFDIISKNIKKYFLKKHCLTGKINTV